MWDVVGDGSGFLFDRGWEFLTGNASSRANSYGIFEGLRGTFWIGVFVVVFAFPLGVGAAIYLEEYASDSRLTIYRVKHQEFSRRSVSSIRSSRTSDIRSSIGWLLPKLN